MHHSYTERNNVIPLYPPDHWFTCTRPHFQQTIAINSNTAKMESVVEWPRNWISIPMQCCKHKTLGELTQNIAHHLDYVSTLLVKLFVLPVRLHKLNTQFTDINVPTWNDARKDNSCLRFLLKMAKIRESLFGLATNTWIWRSAVDLIYKSSRTEPWKHGMPHIEW